MLCYGLATASMDALYSTAAEYVLLGTVRARSRGAYVTTTSSAQSLHTDPTVELAETNREYLALVFANDAMLL